MKHFILSLLCVGACLSAMAINPRLVGTGQCVEGKVTKNDLGLKKLQRNDLMKLPTLREGRNVITPQQFFSERQLTPDGNMLLKKAPRRLSADDLLSPKIAFMQCFEYNEETGMVEQSPAYFEGGWDVDMEQVDDNNLMAYLYYNAVPVNINVDYNEKSAELVMDWLGGWHWCDTTVSGSSARKTYTVNDTVQHLYIIDEDFFLNDNGEFTNISGRIYNDGSIYFADGFCFYTINYVTHSKYNYNWNLTSQTMDTTLEMSPFYHNTYLMTPNGFHTFDMQASESSFYTYGNNVYMYQYDDSTAVAWNLWGLGGRGVYMHIYNDGSMVFPTNQVVATSDVAELEDLYPEFDWSLGYEWIVNGYDEVTGDYLIDDIPGTVTPTTISWGAVQLWRYCTYQGNYYALPTEPLYNNMLTFTDGETWSTDKSRTPTIVSEVLDDCVVVTAVASAPGGEVSLFDCFGEGISNPCYVERGIEDQVLTFYAIEVDNGINPSDVVSADIFIPAMPVVIGDLNSDGRVSLQDIPVLIDLLLGRTSGDSRAADVNGDGEVTITDLVALINQILYAE